MGKWLGDRRGEYERKVDGEGALTDAQKTQMKNKVVDYAGTRAGAVAGVYAQKAMSWGSLYDGIRDGPSQLE